MFRIRFAASRRVLSALVAIAAATSMAACVQGPPDQSDAKVTVQASQPTGTYAPGDDVAVRFTITNEGGKDAANISIATTTDPHVHVKSQKCSPLGVPAAVPDYQACSIYIYPARIAKGASVTIDYVFTVTDGAQGSVASSVEVSLIRGPAAVSATSTATIVDTRSGAYTAWTSDGRRMALAADFASRTLSFTNADLTFDAAFQAPPGNLDYIFDASSGFTQRPGLLAGNVAFGGGTRVFVAARTLLATLADLDGTSFNVFGIDTAADGTSTSTFATAQFSGTTLSTCAAPTPHAVAGCAAASLHTWTVSTDSDGFVAVDGATGDTMHFQLAQAGSAKLLLRGETTGTGRTFALGLAQASLSGGAYRGGDTAGHWNRLVFTSTAMQEVAQDTAKTSTSDLSAIAGTTLGATVVDTDTMPLWIAQSGNLAVVTGRPGTATDGLLQLFAN